MKGERCGYSGGRGSRGVGRFVNGVLEAGRDGSRGAVACRLAADGEQREDSFQRGVVDPPIRYSRQERIYYMCVEIVFHQIHVVRECECRGKEVPSYQNAPADHSIRRWP